MAVCQNITSDVHKLHCYISYYRKLREQGKQWIPKPTSKIAIYCKKHSLNVVDIIEGKQSLILPQGETVIDTEESRILRMVVFFQHKKEEYTKNPPWLPPKNHELRLWCETHNINVEDLINGVITVDKIK